jgi:hypothetical protein
MRPAFSTTAQTVAFCLLLLLLLLSPLWMSGKLLPPRDQGYASAGWDWGPYPWIRKQIFEETNDIDIAFIGSSRMNWGIDTPYVQQQLDLRLGRKSVVRSICWGGAGFDGLYFITRDLLARRHVTTLVFYDEDIRPNPNPKAPKWFRYREDSTDLAGLSWRNKSIYYFAAITGTPDDLMELALPNLPEDTNHQTDNYLMRKYHTANPETRLGAITGRISYDHELGANPSFTPYTPNTRATAAEVCVYGPETATNFVFSNDPPPDWQAFFARKFARLTKEHDCQLVLLHLPVRGEKSDSLIRESQDWPRFLKTDVAMVGVPGLRLFAGLPKGDLELLYGDDFHLNENGQKYFTSVITPVLLQLHENRPVH